MALKWKLQNFNKCPLQFIKIYNGRKKTQKMTLKKIANPISSSSFWFSWSHLWLFYALIRFFFIKITLKMAVFICDILRNLNGNKQGISQIFLPLSHFIYILEHSNCLGNQPLNCLIDFILYSSPILPFEYIRHFTLCNFNGKVIKKSESHTMAKRKSSKEIKGISFSTIQKIGNVQ